MFKNKLIDDQLWLSYLDNRLSKDFISKSEKDDLREFVLNKKYIDIVNSIYNNNYKFSIPEKHVISKGYTSKKRIVYTYSYTEMHLFKYISYLLYDYDYLFSSNLYSFRKSISVKNAVRAIMHVKNKNNMYKYKVDIKNYFNSIDSDILLDMLKKDIKDKSLYNLFYDLLSNNYVKYNGNIVFEKKGAIAGNPLSAFLANYYLRELDEFFLNKKIFYIRYADDIIMFCNSLEEINIYRDFLYNFLFKYKLVVNSNKEYTYNKNEMFEFLGFSFKGNIIDISSNSYNKIKNKIRRSSRGYRRWMIRCNVDYNIVLKTINKKYNRKFFGINNIELSWMYWFFPTINTDTTLKNIDRYMQDMQRYIVTGKHNKKNFKKVPYSILKSNNYKSLVHEYYKLKSAVED